ncbi:MAG: TetR/AcrR family transcriptional regulator [Lachnospiraceae bacterium]|nr:TetR/AcrR family transcriptional regulator [Lachnospiraceae bacterium]
MSENVRKEILDATIGLFNRKGLRFTMDDLAAELHRSKKTIYVFFPDKKHLLDEMVDYIFDSIKDSERRIADDTSLSTVEKIRRVLGAMPEEYRSVDLRQLYVLKEKYPAIYAHVERRLETDWEPTVALMEQGMREGVIRPVSIPVFRTMMQATLEQFFQRDILVKNGITYHEALAQVVDILVDGITVRPVR